MLGIETADSSVICVEVESATTADIPSKRNTLYLDLANISDRNKLADATNYFAQHETKLVILDEIQYMPELFQQLRVAIDRKRRPGRFLILGSASIELMKQSGETMAGRIAFVDLSPFDILEIQPRQQTDLWVRGGFPESLLAVNERNSVRWRENFITTYLERDVPQLGPRVPATTLRRFWTMLAHRQGKLLNAAKLANNLAVTGGTIARYLDLMVDLLLVRRLQPYRANVGKRLVKAPKIYVRDSGIAHTLLRIDDQEMLLGHPLVAASWENFVVENIINVAPARTLAHFYRTSAGAEIDLLLDIPNLGLWAIEIKYGWSPKLRRGFHHARETLRPERCYVVYSGNDRYPMAEGVEAIGLAELCRILQA